MVRPAEQPGPLLLRPPLPSPPRALPMGLPGLRQLLLVYTGRSLALGRPEDSGFVVPQAAPVV